MPLSQTSGGRIDHTAKPTVQFSRQRLTGCEREPKMSDGLLWHRIQFAFTVTYHYLFPQLTMGLALLIVIFKVLALRVREERYNEVARFWTRIFALNFAMGVVTGIPLDLERRTVRAAIGPFWDGNEVWLVAAGGVLFMAFPRLCSAAFSGFYMPLMIVFWLLILRVFVVGVSLAAAYFVLVFRIFRGKVALDEEEHSR
jgi:hypothetical protein